MVREEIQKGKEPKGTISISYACPVSPSEGYNNKSRWIIWEDNMGSEGRKVIWNVTSWKVLIPFKLT